MFWQFWQAPPSPKKIQCLKQSGYQAHCVVFDEKDQEYRCEKVTKQFNGKMHGILGSVWPKINLPPFLKVKEEIFYVYCLYCVGFLVRDVQY